MIASLSAALVFPMALQPLTVQASKLKDIQDKIVNTQNQIADTQDQINGINDEIDRLTDEQDVIQEKIDDLNAEIINTMTSIGMKEDEISAKEGEIADKEVELAAKVVEIDAAQVEYEAAKAREEAQYADMTSRTKLMYENSDVSYLGLLLQGVGLKEALNQMDFIKKVHEYDRLKLEEYEDTKNEVHDLWDFLETEKAQLEADKTQLEADKTQLEADKELLQSQKDNLDTMLEQKKIESDNYEEEIKAAKKEALKAKAQLQKEEKALEKLRKEQTKAQQEAAAAAAAAEAAANAAASAANGNYIETSYTEIIDNAVGSDLGKQIAKYACQYIGNPYVYGGTSLTNGADCSGFVYRVYSDFGYKLPRTSFEQRSAGRSVDYSEAQPGDLICYDGHIGIYIGSGKIVHASTKKTGIKVSNAGYRPILSVRRIIP